MRSRTKKNLLDHLIEKRTFGTSKPIMGEVGIKPTKLIFLVQIYFC